MRDHAHREADDRYNSGLFHFKPEKGREIPDELSLKVTVDDKPLKEILKRLYYPDSPYEFAVLPAEILGQVYEQFLGSVIHLTAGHHARIEQKPEVRKAGGVYYTPAYIVKYIVENTVGKLLEGKKPGPRSGVNNLRILDPACGSGSFLIAAYQHLVDWHRDRYVEDGPEKHTKELFRGLGGEWRLATDEKKRILLNNIYGVDIDPQAVEVTKLSLLLKVLDGETQESIRKQLQLFKERALPDLGANIKCGNSLIASDFYQEQQKLFDDAERYRINAFDWQREFPTVFGAGGFDVIIGNPPYIRIQAMTEWAPDEVGFYKRRFVTASKGNYDIYVVFVERGLQLLNEHGRLGFILPHKFFTSKYGMELRRMLGEGGHVEAIVHFGDQQVFSNATTYTCLMFLGKERTEESRVVTVNDLASWRAGEVQVEGHVQLADPTGQEWHISIGTGADLFSRLAKIPLCLGDVATRIYQGSITSADSVFLFKEYEAQASAVTAVHSVATGERCELESELLKPVIRSGNIGHYAAQPTALVLFPYRVEDGRATLLPAESFKEQYPRAWAYLRSNRNLLEAREKGRFADSQWYRFGRSQNLGLWEQRKLMIPYMITELSAYYDAADNYYFINVTTGGYGVTVDEARISYVYLCGLLNSKVLDFHLRRVSTPFRGGYIAANKQFIERLPILVPSGAGGDAQRHEVEGLVVDLHSLARRVRSLAGHERTALERQIQLTSEMIDAHVEDIYGLSDEDRAAMRKTV